MKINDIWITPLHVSHNLRLPSFMVKVSFYNSNPTKEFCQLQIFIFFKKLYVFFILAKLFAKKAVIECVRSYY